MDLDEVVLKWNAYDWQQGQVVKLNTAMLRAASLDPVRSGMQRESRSARREAGLWLLVVIALGGFIAGHLGKPGVAISAVATDVFCIGMLIALIRRSVVAAAIDLSQPVAGIQREMEALRLLRIRTTQWGLLFGTLLWVPGIAVVAQAIFGSDLYAGSSPAWLIANALFGLALFPAAIWTARNYKDRFERSPFLRRLMNDLAGDNLRAAQDALARLRAFETE